MTSKLVSEKTPYKKIISTLSAGAIASLVTQPFQVLKTNMINSPTMYLKDLHQYIVRRGWTQYMRGSPLAVIRQAYGFAIYTSMIQYLNSKVEILAPSINKYYKYSFASLVGKFTAMLFQAPLTLLKTRMEVISTTTFREQLRQIIKNPRQQFAKAFGITLAREASYSLIHYNVYRFLKDDILMGQMGIDSAFFPAFISGILAITISQPFEVIRSKVSLISGNASAVDCFIFQLKTCGWRGLFTGYLPRLLRKPINSGVSWAIIESIRNSE